MLRLLQRMLVSVVRRALAGSARSGSSRRSAIAVLVRAFPQWIALIVVLVLLAGALPAVFAALVAQLVEALPRTVASGFDSPAGRQVVVVLVAIAVVLALREVVSAISGVTTAVLFRLYDEHLLARVMSSTLAVPGLELFENPALAAKTDRAVRIPGFGPGEFVEGLLMKGAVRAQGLAATVLVAAVWPVAAIPLALVWTVVGNRLQVNYESDPNFGTDSSSWTEPLRRSRYLKEVGLMPAWAKELRIFGLVEWLGDRFGRQSAVVLGELIHARRVGERVILLLLAGIIAANTTVLAIAAHAALNGTLSLGQLTLLTQGLLGMAALASQDGDGFIANGSMAIPDVLELERTVAQLGGGKPGRVHAQGLPRHYIAFRHVQFRYPERDAQVFNDLDFRIEAGQSIGVVGLNGAGKTTLIKLLTGLETPRKGEIVVDGTSLTSLDPESWHRNLAVIFQDFMRFELPARDNIGFGAIDALGSDQDVMAAATAAGAKTIVDRLPDGLGTTLSRRYSGGTDLSGGQWQRIALARAMMAVRAGAHVLVLDEPTAQLDVRAEADLYDKFLDITRGLTTIVISHRFSTVRRANRIVVLNGGRITEDGSHTELVTAGGEYARLFNKQAQRYSDNDGGGQ